MPRYIDVDTVVFDITGLARISPYNFRGIAFYFLEQLDSMPSADVRENVRSEWTLVTDRYGANGEYVWKCSSCNKMTICKGDFCPNCGADMRQDHAD